MAASARSTWRGTFKISLISIPIRAYPATKPDADVSFRQFHRRCRTRIQLRKWCPHCEEEVAAADIVKGHETSRGRYVFVDDKDVDKLRPQASKTLVVSDVIDAAQIDPRYVERVYYLAPESAEAGEAFAVVREALADRAAIGRLSLHGREYLTAVIAGPRSLLLYTLRTAGEVRSVEDVEGLDLARKGRVNAGEVRLARRVLDTFESRKPLADFVDNYQVALREMLKKKGAGTAVEEPGADERAPGVVNLMDALRQSLDSARSRGTSGRRTQPKRRKARVLAHPGRRKVRRAS
jgi:DNA end-binding protein Ku